MVYFADLTPYTYGGGRSDVRALNVGWLSRLHAFPTAPPEPRLVEALNRCCFRGTRWAMGIHTCELCGEKWACARVGDRKVGIGTGEIFVEHANVVYAAPTLVVHYVEAHSYLPPGPFVAGALAKASRIAILSHDECEAIGSLPFDEQRRLACEALERMVERSAHTWARPALAAARAGHRDWDAAVPAELEDDDLLGALAKLSFLMGDASAGFDPEVLRHDVLKILELSRDASDERG